jgi:2-keto-4-pentenoate hydratase/2-oxohepta-3-ene-1,7-dioic acid hydratase in catechol pathway
MTLISIQSCEFIQFLSCSAFSTSTVRTMRFVQFERSGDSVSVGVLSEDGAIVHDLSSLTGGSNMVQFIAKGVSLETVKGALNGCPKLKASEVKLVSPITNPEKIVCVGLNYRGHCEEQNKAPPKEPMFFSKYASAITGPTGDVVAHSISDVSIEKRVSRFF